jgi:hypothetical protein
VIHGYARQADVRMACLYHNLFNIGLLEVQFFFT